MSGDEHATGVDNVVAGTVVGPTVQAGRIYGDVHFHLEFPPGGPPPRELPADTPFFVGRAEQLARFAAVGGRSPWVVSGMAGIGKTAFAVHLAHRLSDAYPDGCLFVDLHGHTPEVEPVRAEDALDRMLHALGVPRARTPVGLDGKSALYRSLLAGTRTVVVLDNAGSAAQVRPLLPGAPGCLVLVTSRRQLAALDDGIPVPLATLSETDGVTLLRQIAGTDRIDADPGSSRRIVGCCAGLPLAIRICAARLRNRPSWTPAELLTRLEEQGGTLAELTDGDRSVAAAFTVSYRDLPADQRRAFRLLATHPGADIDSHAAAALLGEAVDHARRSCDALVDAHLLSESTANRYHFHDLVRTFGVTLAEDPARHTALTALFDHYLHTAAAAMDQVFPDEKPNRPVVAPVSSPHPPFPDPAHARTWLDTERRNLVQVCRHAPGHAVDLAAVLYRYLDVCCYLADAVVVHTCAQQAAEDRPAEAAAWTRLSNTHWQRGSFTEAADAAGRAVTLFEALGDRAGHGRALNSLAIILWRQGCYAEAEHHSREALTVHRAIADRAGAARALGNLALVHWRRGRLDRAIHRNQQALALYRDLGDTRGQARAMGNLGNVLCQQGNHEEAVSYHRRALALYRSLSDRAGEADALTNLGVACHHLGQHDQAADHHTRALTLFRDIGDADGEARAHNGLAEHLTATSNAQRACEEHQLALAIAQQTGDRHEQSRAHQGLANAWRASGDAAQATAHDHQAAAIWC
jgi:tetratricopeptide (TPR) repeat protein